MSESLWAANRNREAPCQPSIRGMTRVAIKVCCESVRRFGVFASEVNVVGESNKINSTLSHS